MNISIEKLQMYAALGVLALLICTVIAIVCALLWYFDSCNREMRHERRRTVQLRNRRIEDRKRLIQSRGEL